MNRNLLSKSIAEFIGAFAIVFFGCGYVVVSAEDTGALRLTPVVFGATVGLMIYAVGHISGAHFNPAVTLGFAAVRRFPWREVPHYIVFQVLGATAAAFVLSVTIPGIPHFATTTPTIPLLQAFFLEVVFTFFLMFVIISVATDSRAVGLMAGIAIGATVTVDAFLGGPLTGASMNPARTLGPAFLESDYAALWIYLLGPTIGAVGAAYLYEFLRCETSADHGRSPERRHVKGCC